MESLLRGFWRHHRWSRGTGLSHRRHIQHIDMTSHMPSRVITTVAQPRGHGQHRSHHLVHSRFCLPQARLCSRQTTQISISLLGRARDKALGAPTEAAAATHILLRRSKDISLRRLRALRLEHPLPAIYATVAQYLTRLISLDGP